MNKKDTAELIRRAQVIEKEKSFYKGAIEKLASIAEEHTSSERIMSLIDTTCENVISKVIEANEEEIELLKKYKIEHLQLKDDNVCDECEEGLI